jgi:phage terminase small subunit
MSQLTAKQARFIEEYVVDFNGTQAAIRAGYSKKCAKSIADHNLSRPEIARAIAKKREELSANAVINRNWVLQGIVDLVEMSKTLQNPAGVGKGLELAMRMIGEGQSTSLKLEGVVAVDSTEKKKRIAELEKKLGIK